MQLLQNGIIFRLALAPDVPKAQHRDAALCRRIFGKIDARVEIFGVGKGGVRRRRVEGYADLIGQSFKQRKPAFLQKRAVCRQDRVKSLFPSALDKTGQRGVQQRFTEQMEVKK